VTTRKTQTFLTTSKIFVVNFNTAAMYCS